MAIEKITGVAHKQNVNAVENRNTQIIAEDINEIVEKFNGNADELQTLSQKNTNLDSDLKAFSQQLGKVQRELVLLRQMTERNTQDLNGFISQEYEPFKEWVVNTISNYQ